MNKRKVILIIVAIAVGITILAVVTAILLTDSGEPPPPEKTEPPEMERTEIPSPAGLSPRPIYPDDIFNTQPPEETSGMVPGETQETEYPGGSDRAADGELMPPHERTAVWPVPIYQNEGEVEKYEN